MDSKTLEKTMDHDILLKDGSILRFASLGGHCVHITHGADGRGIGSISVKLFDYPMNSNQASSN